MKNDSLSSIKIFNDNELEKNTMAKALEKDTYVF